MGRQPLALARVRDATLENAPESLSGPCERHWPCNLRRAGLSRASWTALRQSNGGLAAKIVRNDRTPSTERPSSRRCRWCPSGAARGPLTSAVADHTHSDAGHSERTLSQSLQTCETISAASRTFLCRATLLQQSTWYIHPSGINANTRYSRLRLRAATTRPHRRRAKVK